MLEAADLAASDHTGRSPEGDSTVHDPIYLDNSSTSFPKPEAVWQAARDYLDHLGVSPGRSSYRRARTAERLIESARESVAVILGVRKASHIAFTSNATHSLNIAIKGCLSRGDHVVTTDLEHNSVLRPLEALQRAGMITYTVVRTDAGGGLDVQTVEAAMRPETRLVAMTHASNVTGVVTPIAEVAELAHRHGALFLLDAAQTAGLLDIDADAGEIDMVAFTGHKWLYGPPGTGGLFVRDPSEVRPLMEGGTGHNSHSALQPLVMPSKFEAGTLNYLGIAGLLAAITESGGADRMASLRRSVSTTTQSLVSGLHSIPGITVYRARPDIPHIPVVSINVEGLYPGEVTALLDEEFGILTRSGLHCAPLVHQTLGTAPHGTVRLSLGANTSIGEIEATLDALAAIRDRTAALR